MGFGNLFGMGFWVPPGQDLGSYQDIIWGPTTMGFGILFGMRFGGLFGMGFGVPPGRHLGSHQAGIWGPIGMGFGAPTTAAPFHPPSPTPP